MHYLLRGFTLIELLISISILAILLSLSYAGLNSVLLSHARISEQQTHFKSFNQSFSQLHHALQHIVPRTVTDAYGTLQPALSLNYNNGLTLSFTRLGYPNPSNLQRSSLQRIRYFMEDSSLKKRLWLAPDSADMTLFQQEELLDAIQSINIEALAENDQWYTTWPPQQDMPLTLLPKALRISLVREGQEEFIQLITLPR